MKKQIQNVPSFKLVINAVSLLYESKGTQSIVSVIWWLRGNSPAPWICLYMGNSFSGCGLKAQLPKPVLYGWKSCNYVETWPSHGA